MRQGSRGRFDATRGGASVVASFSSFPLLSSALLRSPLLCSALLCSPLLSPLLCPLHSFLQNLLLTSSIRQTTTPQPTRRNGNIVAARNLLNPAPQTSSTFGTMEYAGVEASTLGAAAGDTIQIWAYVRGCGSKGTGSYSGHELYVTEVHAMVYAASTTSDCTGICPSGTFSAGDAGSCTSCNNYEYATEGSSRCESCPAGRFGTTPSATSTCSGNCQAGKVSGFVFFSRLLVLSCLVLSCLLGLSRRVSCRVVSYHLVSSHFGPAFQLSELQYWLHLVHRLRLWAVQRRAGERCLRRLRLWALG